MRLGPWEIALIALVVIVLFGTRKIPELMRGLGTGLKEFKKAVKEEEPAEPSSGSPRQTDSNYQKGNNKTS